MRRISECGSGAIAEIPEVADRSRHNGGIIINEIIVDVGGVLLNGIISAAGRGRGNIYIAAILAGIGAAAGFIYGQADQVISGCCVVVAGTSNCGAAASVTEIPVINRA